MYKVPIVDLIIIINVAIGVRFNLFFSPTERGSVATELVESSGLGILI